MEVQQKWRLGIGGVFFKVEEFTTLFFFYADGNDLGERHK